MKVTGSDGRLRTFTLVGINYKLDVKHYVCWNCNEEIAADADLGNIKTHVCDVREKGGQIDNTDKAKTGS